MEAKEGTHLREGRGPTSLRTQFLTFLCPRPYNSAWAREATQAAGTVTPPGVTRPGARRGGGAGRKADPWGLPMATRRNEAL